MLPGTFDVVVCTLKITFKTCLFLQIRKFSRVMQCQVASCE